MLFLNRMVMVTLEGQDTEVKEEYNWRMTLKWQTTRIQTVIVACFN